MTFGKGIRRLRERRGGSVQDLAVRARIPWATLLMIEADWHFPRLSELERLLHALDARFKDIYRASLEVD